LFGVCRVNKAKVTMLYTILYIIALKTISGFFDARNLQILKMAEIYSIRYCKNVGYYIAEQCIIDSCYFVQFLGIMQLRHRMYWLISRDFITNTR